MSNIRNGDSFSLRKALRNHEINTIVLASPGGLVMEGLNMAGIIFDKGLNVYVPEKAICASSCAFMFFAGKERKVRGKLGVHQFYTRNASASGNINETENVVQFTVSEIIGFLNEFETPRFVFERMFQQQEMYYFDQGELDQLMTINFPVSETKQIASNRFWFSKMNRNITQETIKPKITILSIDKASELSKEQIIDLLQKYYEKKEDKVGSKSFPNVFPALKDIFNNLSLNFRKEIQKKLKAELMYNNRIDGKWGKGTLMGIAQFSARKINTIELENPSTIASVYAHLLPGVLDEKAIKNDISSNAYKYSIIGNQFKSLPLGKRQHVQAALKHLGFYKSSIDGLWGKVTSFAISEYARVKNQSDKLHESLKANALLSEIQGEFKYTPPKKKKTYKHYKRLVSNPRYGLKQALAICNPLASEARQNALERAQRNNEMGYSTLAQVATVLNWTMQANSAYRRVRAACLAEKGWKQK